MKKLKKTICIILSLTFILSAAFSFPLSADAATKNGTKYPTMVIGGINDMHYIYSDKNDPNSEKLAYDLTDIDASAVAKEIAAPLAKGIATGNYHDYCAAVLKSVEPIFSKLKLDNNGEASNGSGVLWKYNPDNVKNMRRWDKVFFITDYGTDVTRSDGDSVGYDWRLDPGVTADMIYVYAQEILRKTGAEKINFIFRCEGCTAGLVFIAKYADSLPINNVEFSWPTCLGITAISDVFSGKLKLDANALERYLRIDKDEIISKLDSKYADAAALGIAFVSVLNSFKLLNIPLSEVKKIYKKVKNQLMPDLILETYGTMPGYWAMVDDEDYEDAKKLVFSGRENEYAKLIEKIDDYHYNYQVKYREIIDNLKKTGAGFSVITKYGYQLAPIIEGCDDQSDDMISLRYTSMGSYSSDVGKTLTDEYISERENLGLGGYISPDKIVDASVGASPDSTWYIANCRHNLYPNGIFELLADILNTDGQPTVKNFKKFPQFMTIDGNDNLIPLTSENIPADKFNTSTSKSLKNFFNTLFALIKKLFSRIFKK